jgi:polyisoprenoid-binding protein YceI
VERTQNRWNLVALVALCCLSTGARAADLELSRADTSISFELDSTLHRVEGTAQLREGSVHFDPAGGAASGSVVIDARSLETGNGLRDGQMHDKVLESERHPSIEFVPSSLVVESRGETEAQVALVGVLRMHGGEWPLRIPASVRAEGEAVHVEGSFTIPYVEWGMRDMSNFLLSVDPEVVVHIDALATLTPPLEVADAAQRGKAPSANEEVAR